MVEPIGPAGFVDIGLYIGGILSSEIPYCNNYSLLDWGAGHTLLQTPPIKVL